VRPCAFTPIRAHSGQRRRRGIQPQPGLGHALQVLWVGAAPQTGLTQRGALRGLRRKAELFRHPLRVLGHRLRRVHDVNAGAQLRLDQRCHKGVVGAPQHDRVHLSLPQGGAEAGDHLSQGWGVEEAQLDLAGQARAGLQHQLGVLRVLLDQAAELQAAQRAGVASTPTRLDAE